MFNNIPEQDFKEILDQTQSEVCDFAGKTVLILGGSGFLGTMFKYFFLYCNRELRHSIKIISIDNYVGRTPPIEIQDDNLIHIQHDLSIPLWYKLIDYKCDFIINASGNAAPSTYERYPVETLTVSTETIKHLLEFARYNNARILNFSSSEVLGTPDAKDIPTNENVRPSVLTMDKRSPYDVAKLFIETISWVYWQKHGVNVRVVRPFNVIGYFGRHDFRVISKFMYAAKDNKPITVYKPATQTRTFCWYGDFIAGAIKVLTKSNDFLYHLGKSSEEVDMRTLASLVEKITNKDNLVKYVDPPTVYLQEPTRRCPSIEKARRELNYNPQVTLTDALERIWAWTQSQP